MEIEQTQPKRIGLKQSIRAIREGNAKYVVLADDADQPIRDEVIDECRKMNVRLETTESKASLGHQCGIECHAAVVCFLNDAVPDKN